MNFGDNFEKARNCTEEPEKRLNGFCGVTFFFFFFFFFPNSLLLSSQVSLVLGTLQTFLEMNNFGPKVTASGLAPYFC